jgi:hypothetical protein
MTLYNLAILAYMQDIGDSSNTLGTKKISKENAEQYSQMR